ncbi:hemin uptake protein HemP [Methylocystis sp. JAN1]|uniref:hemin uptake protein HemP n=1 Tax=Methylocystis sp. JAN1 TaxID=3397211 RepID=UPI003FA2A9B8
MEKQPKAPRHGEPIAPRSEAGNAVAPLEIESQELLGPRREATIIHAGERYRLRITANNKLILTK